MCCLGHVFARKTTVGTDLGATLGRPIFSFKPWNVADTAEWLVVMMSAEAREAVVLIKDN
jgi:hypothetical protein